MIGLSSNNFSSLFLGQEIIEPPKIRTQPIYLHYCPHCLPSNVLQKNPHPRTICYDHWRIRARDLMLKEIKWTGIVERERERDEDNVTYGQRGAWLDSTKGFTCKIVYVAASHYTLHARLPCFGFWLNNFVFF